MSTQKKLMTNWRWWIIALLFIATTVNYLDRQVLSLTWKDFIAPQFHWNDNDYGTITSIFSIAYAICMLFAGHWNLVRRSLPSRFLRKDDYANSRL